MPDDRQLIHPISAGFAIAGIAAMVWAHLVSDTGWIRILDDANLIFHEAGHPIFGLLGSTLGLYGGTLGQLTFPAVAAGTFWRQRQPLSTALCIAWFFENFWNIARYMADARSQLLPLIGGGEHDWMHIFTRWGVLSHDTAIAGFTAFLGWAGIVGCAGWILTRALQDNNVIER